MPKFYISSWEEHTLHDSQTYEVEAETLEEAAKKLHKYQAIAQRTRDDACDISPETDIIELHASNPFWFNTMVILRPQEVVATDSGYIQMESPLGGIMRNLTDSIPSCSTRVGVPLDIDWASAEADAEIERTADNFSGDDNDSISKELTEIVAEAELPKEAEFSEVNPGVFEAFKEEVDPVSGTYL